VKAAYIFMIVLCFFRSEIFGQTYPVSGKVKDAANQAVPFANVFLLQVADSVVVTGTSADENGFFRLEGVVPDTYFLQASYIGQSSELVAVDVRGPVAIGTIMMGDHYTELEEVEVTGRNPTIERQADRLVFMVENTVASHGNSWDLLKKTPGVVMVGDKLQIRNQVPTIYLNNRKVQLSSAEIKNLLEGFSGGNIKSVEVIMDPPSSYEAESGPILNINTSKNLSPGYKGSVNGEYTQAVYPKYSLGTGHFYKTERFNLFAGYSVSPRKEIRETDSYINFIDGGQNVFARWETDYARTTRSVAQNANMILDYTIDSRNSMNLTSNLAISPNKTFSNRTFTDMRNAQDLRDSTLISLSDVENDQTNLAVDLSYDHRFKKEGTSLSLSVHYTSFEEDQLQGVSSDYFDPSGSFIRNYGFYTDSQQRIEIVTGQADYNTGFGKVSMEAGGKYSAINSVSGIGFYDQDGTARTYNPGFSDDFDYDETVFAAYLALTGNWDKWSVKGGLRGEQTNVEGKSLSIVEPVLQDYFELFPTFYTLYTPSDGHSFSFSYTRKLTRPRYSDLNPFRYFLTENDFNVGNPGLAPNFSHNFNLNYTLRESYFLDVYYRDNGAYISTLSFQDNGAQTLRQIKQNVLESTSYGLDLTYSKSITSQWFLYAYSSLFHEEETFLAVESGNVPATNEVDGLYLSLANYLTLSKDGTFTGELGLTYMSRFLEGSYQLGETTNLTVGLRKTVWKERASLSIAVEDILDRANGRMRSKYLNQDNAYLVVPESQFVRIGFTYNFGNFGLQDNKRAVDQMERNRID
tara:strand:+ start:71579 stop:73990 length:2412 start_codon:yes stop_codon:yes gene_type:complete